MGKEELDSVFTAFTILSEVREHHFNNCKFTNL